MSCSRSHEWISDAASVASVIPSEAPVAAEINYLLNEVLQRSVPYGTERPEGYQVGHNFWIREQETWHPEQDTVASVERIFGDQSLVLPPRNPYSPKGNGMIFLHELQHITEYEVGITPDEIPDFYERVGVAESRSYKLNGDILHAIDGSDYNAYVDSLPFDIIMTPNVDGTTMYQPINLFVSKAIEPPRETFTHEMWSEDGYGVNNLVMTAVAKKLEAKTAHLDPFRARKLAGYVLRGESNA